tara:strand:- start:309 stop:497 length:189 start_codon:yes stop_codon:yes gene_type:complete
MNEATAKRWIADLPLSKDERTDALEFISGKDRSAIKTFLTQLRQKSGSKHYMNKKTKPFWTK